ncbi:putative Phosphorylated adaptor for RNA export [Operophtera brumata]|uniref:Putative Phosphorylated adaptor for RNA export n=1 Tax=Operophtera brumata TaxID=104452 RepID=A0A0L7KVP0_OPEBR|nr:putative Phosphorylated adaptor for RNA export [Operophtera brumata]
MVSCDVTKKRSLGIESYDYTIKYRLDDNYSKKVFTNNDVSERTSNKRKNSDRCNVKLRLGKRVNSHQFPREKQQPRLLPDLLVLATDPETMRIVQVLGAGKAMEIYKETQRVEADGGMLVMHLSSTDSEIPSLSRGEAIVQSEHGSNPPPSPATDARDCSSDTDGHTDGHVDRPNSPPPPQDPRALQEYDDGDYLEVMCNDDMDLF